VVVINIRYKDKSLNTKLIKICVDFFHHQQGADDNRSFIFLAFSAQTMVLYKHTITTAKEKLK